MRWALHNVGIDWARLAHPECHFEFALRSEHLYHDPNDYDLTFWGCSRTRPRTWRYLIDRPSLRSFHWMTVPTARSITVVHEPCEIFPQVEDWRSRPPNSKHLKGHRALGVISNEMANILSDLGFDCSIINTRSTLPLRSAHEINPDTRLSLCSRARPHRRKNIPLLHALRDESEKKEIGFNVSLGIEVLPEVDYIKWIDSHSCYVCTSWQEGGPLPLMDAIHRGCAVLTTPVGQTDEYVRHGENGFFCHTQAEFSEKIALLKSDPALLHEMRLRALELAAARSEERIRDQLQAFLQTAR